jgi:ABC-type multidrug transport system permease subunit
MCLYGVQVLIELPYVIFQTVIYSSITYAMVNFEWTPVKFCWYMYFMFITFITFTYYGMMWVSLSPNSEIASVIAGFFYSFFNVFSGFFIPRPVRNLPSSIYSIINRDKH